MILAVEVELYSALVYLEIFLNRVDQVGAQRGQHLGRNVVPVVDEHELEPLLRHSAAFLPAEELGDAVEESHDGLPLREHAAKRCEEAALFLEEVHEGHLRSAEPLRNIFIGLPRL